MLAGCAALRCRKGADGEEDRGETNRFHLIEALPGNQFQAKQRLDGFGQVVRCRNDRASAEEDARMGFGQLFPPHNPPLQWTGDGLRVLVE